MKLEDKIEAWIKDNPDRSYAGKRMLEQLDRVRKEFTGLDAVRLEGLVEETLNRQFNIDEARKQGLEASVKLSDSIQKLKDGLNSMKKSTARLAEAALGIEAAAHKITTKQVKTEASKPNKDLSYVPKVPKVVDKSLN